MDPIFFLTLKFFVAGFGYILGPCRWPDFGFLQLHILLSDF